MFSDCFRGKNGGKLCVNFRQPSLKDLLKTRVNPAKYCRKPPDIVVIQGEAQRATFAEWVEIGKARVLRGLRIVKHRFLRCASDL